MTASRLSRLTLAALLTTLLFGLAVWLLYQLQPVVVWIILALFLAIGLSPGVDWLHRHRVPRALAILLIYLVVLVAIAVIGVVVEPPLAQQVGQLRGVLGQAHGLSQELNKIVGPFGLSGLVASIGPDLDRIPAQLSGSIGSLSSITQETLGTITAAFGVIVIGFFFLYDGRQTVRRATELLAPPLRPVVTRVLEQSAQAIFSYLRGNLAISAIAGATAFVGMAVLGIPYALPLAILLAVFDLIPMVGVIVGAVPVVLAALTISPVKGVVILVYVVVYSQIESNVLNPLIYGRRDELPGLVVFLAFVVGSLLFGIFGALIAIPAANIIRVVVREWLNFSRAGTTRGSPEATQASTSRRSEEVQVDSLDRPTKAT